MSTPTLVYSNGLAQGAAQFLGILDTLLTNPFSPTTPKGLGWSRIFSDGYFNGDKLYFSLGMGQSERIYLRLTADNTDTFIDRTICTVAHASDGYMLNAMGGDGYTKITVGS